MKGIPLLGLCLLAFVVPMQGAIVPRPQIEWVQAFATDAHETVTGIASGTDDTLYLGSALPAGNLQIGNSLVSSNGPGSHDIVSVSPAGDGLNSFRPSSGDVFLYPISTDRFGNIAMAGYHHGTTNLGSHVVYRTEFVALLSPDGTWLNAGSFGRPLKSPVQVTADADGNIYACGDMRTVSYFGNDTMNLTGGAEGHGFVAKLNTAGSWEWILIIEQSGTVSSHIGSRIEHIALDGDGNVVVTGYWATGLTASFGNHELGAGSASFAAQISPSGTVQWLRVFRSGTFPHALHTDRHGDIYVAGRFPNLIPDLDPLVSAINTNQADFYIGRLDSSGQFDWGRPGYHSGDWIRIDDISTDAGGNVYLGGNIESGAVTFGSDTITGNPVEGFVAAMDPAGDWMWAVKMPGENGSSSPVRIAGTGSNGVYFSRNFEDNPVTIGTTTFTNSPASIDSDMYFGKISTFDPRLVPRPVITQHPSPVKTLSGGSATFQVVATGTNVQYQWLRDGTPLVPANGPSLFLVQLTRANQGNYSVQVWNTGGTNTSNPARLQVLSPVQIGPLERDAQGRFGFRFFDPSAIPFTTDDIPSFDILVSTNLLHWESATNPATWTNGAFRFTDVEATNSPTRFYRTRER